MALSYLARVLEIYKYHCIVNGEFKWFQGYEKKFESCYFVKITVKVNYVLLPLS